jgi:hypothetical protein
MGYHARFFVPALPAVAVAAAAGWDAVAPRFVETRARWTIWIAAMVALYWLGAVEHGGPRSPDRLPWPAYLAPVAITAWLVSRRERGRTSVSGLDALLVAGAACSLGALPFDVDRPRADAEYVARSGGQVTTVRGIDDLERCLPNISTVYHSEVGVPGMVFPDAKVVDLSGLMSREIALERIPFDALCDRDRPEAIFLPHKNYVAKNLEIQQSACLKRYTRVVRLSSSPLYVRSDLAPAFSACARDVAAFQ